MFQHYVLLALGLCLSPICFAQEAAVQARLARVDALTRLDDASLKPWYMKVQFDIPKRQWQKTDTGTLEEWWVGPSQYKWTVASSNYNATYVVNATGKFRSKGSKPMPYLLEVLERQMVHPLPTTKDVEELKPVLVATEGKAPLDCVMYDRKISSIEKNPLGLFPSFCMEKDKDILEASYDFGALAVVRKSVGLFQRRIMPIDVLVTLDRQDALSAHLVMLKTVQTSETDFAETADMESVNVQRFPADSQDVILTPTAQPMIGGSRGIPAQLRGRPARARLLIGTDGCVHSVRLIWAPSLQLATGAMASMIDWRYEPPKYHGKVVETEADQGIFYNDAQ